MKHLVHPRASRSGRCHCALQSVRPRSLAQRCVSHSLLGVSQDARANRAVAVAQRAGPQPVVPEVLELYPDTWEAAIGQPRRTFVEFYAPWCPYCKRLEPIWAQLATDLSKTNSDVQIARLNADTYVDFMPRYDVQGFPTLVLFENGRPISTYQGRADLEPLTKFVS
jgi:protein disulfide-isomerase-like protein